MAEFDVTIVDKTGERFRVHSPTTRFAGIDWISCLGVPCAEFPFLGQLPSVWTWPQLSAWLDKEGNTVRVQFHSGSCLEISGVGVFGRLWHRVESNLSACFPDCVSGTKTCTLPSCGIKLLQGQTMFGRLAVAEVILLPLGSPEIEAELLLPMAEKYLRPNKKADKLLSRFVRDLPYSLLRLPQSDYAIVRSALEDRDWSFALLCFLSSVWKYGEELTSAEMEFVRILSGCLGCTTIEKEARMLADFGV